MRGINKRLVLPSLLASVVLVSGTLLVQSAVEGEKTTSTQAEVLPISSERVVTQEDVPPPQPTEQIYSPTVQSTPTKESTPPTTPPTEPKIANTPIATSVPATIQATLVIQGPGISVKQKIELTEGDTVYALLKKAGAKFDFSLKVSHHSSLGVFVEGFNGTLNDPKTNRYWLYYVNGQFASRGVSAQIVKEGDIIKWVYE